MKKKEANKITGGLSAPGKMPEGSYNLPARACHYRRQACARSQARHALAAMHSRAVTISQTLRMP